MGFPIYQHISYLVNGNYQQKRSSFVLIREIELYLKVPSTSSSLKICTRRNDTVVIHGTHNRVFENCV